MIKLKDIIEQKKVLEELGLNEGPSTEEKRIAICWLLENKPNIEL